MVKDPVFVSFIITSLNRTAFLGGLGVSSITVFCAAIGPVDEPAADWLVFLMLPSFDVAKRPYLAHQAVLYAIEHLVLEDLPVWPDVTHYAVLLPGFLVDGPICELIADLPLLVAHLFGVDLGHFELVLLLIAESSKVFQLFELLLYLSVTLLQRLSRNQGIDPLPVPYLERLHAGRNQLVVKMARHLLHLELVALPQEEDDHHEDSLRLKHLGDHLRQRFLRLLLDLHYRSSFSMSVV